MMDDDLKGDDEVHFINDLTRRLFMILSTYGGE